MLWLGLGLPVVHPQQMLRVGFSARAIFFHGLWHLYALALERLFSLESYLRIAELPLFFSLLHSLSVFFLVLESLLQLTVV
jgi:hypothetical protein